MSSSGALIIPSNEVGIGGPCCSQSDVGSAHGVVGTGCCCCGSIRPTSKGVTSLGNTGTCCRGKAGAVVNVGLRWQGAATAT